MINSQAYRIVTWQPFIEKAPLSATTKSGRFEDDTNQNMM
jgi:hypothetical protein